MIRYGAEDGFVLFAPELTGKPDFVEHGSVKATGEGHSAEEIVGKLGIGSVYRMLADVGIVGIEIVEDRP